MRSVLFVCTANICRSAYAQLAAAHRTDGIEVHSAGTHASAARPIDVHIAAELERRGVDSTGFVSRTLTHQMVDEADLVLTAEAAHRRFVLQERPVAVGRTFTLGQFASALADVPPEAVGTDLLAAVRRARATARREDDVADPYGRGPEAAARAAAHLDDLLDQVLPRIAASR